MSAVREKLGRGLVKAQPWLLRNGDRIWRPLRRFKPVLKIGPVAILTRHADVRAVLERDDVFSVTYGEHMEAVTGPFILGWDDGPRYRHEVGALRAATPPGDLPRIAAITRASARTFGDAFVLADEAVGAGLSRYFGLPGLAGPASRDDARAVFRAVFLDAETPAVVAAGREASARLVAEIRAEIARVRDGDGGDAETVLARLLAAGDLDDDAIPRNLVGLVAAWAASVPRAFALALDALLDHPVELAKVRAAAERGDEAEVGSYWMEALRLQPQAPFLSRRARGEMVVAPGSPRELHVKAGNVVIAVTMSAMRDKHALDAPQSFRPDRPDEQYLHFGAGIHTCFGAAISRTQFGVLGTKLLSGRDVRRAGPLAWGEAFPASLPLVA